jgi:hypothetical protein
MTTDDDFDRQIRDYLESGPAELADRVLWAARAQLKTTRRRRSWFAWLAPWRNTHMTQRTRLLAAGGALVIVVAISAGLFGSIFAPPNPGPGSSGTPPASGFSPTQSAPSSTVAPVPSSSVVPARAAGWYATGGMTEPRSRHTATLLSDGKVLVAGGRIGPDGHAAATSAELYDPRSRTWSATGGMHDGRSGQTATLLQDGTVLVVGGMISAGDSVLNAELYDPVSGTWTATAAMPVAGQGHTATLLSNGKVLIVGGLNGPQHAELYDPVSGTWTATGYRTTRGLGHTATLLPDGRVLVVGYTSRLKDGASSAELYDPGSGSWSATGNLGQLNTPHTATLLPDGSVLVVGCGAEVGKGKPTANAELYDPISGSWKAVGHMLENHGIACAATLLADGRVLVAGGSNATGASASAELYDPGTRTWSAAQKMGLARAGQTATLLPGGQVLVAGGQNVIIGSFSPVASAELYEPGVGN